VMMIIGALLGPLVGGQLAQRGAAAVLSLGAAAMAAGDAMLATAQGLAGYLGAWVVFGLAGSMMLQVPAYTAVVERHGQGARKTIGLLMVFTGLSTTLSWPLMAMLNAELGWRAVLLGSAGFHVLVSLPLLAWALPARPAQAAAGEVAAQAARPLDLTARERRLAFGLIALSTSLFAFVTFGLSPQLIALMSASGGGAAALALASAKGFLGITARLGDMIAGRRFSPPAVAMLAGTLFVAGFPLLLLGQGQPVMLAGFIACYAMGAGLLTVVRSVLPLTFFSLDEFGRQSGRLALPQNAAIAFAPIIFATLIDRSGALPAAWLSLLIALAALTSMGALLSLEKRARRRAALELVP